MSPRAAGTLRHVEKSPEKGDGPIPTAWQELKTSQSISTVLTPASTARYVPDGCAKGRSAPCCHSRQGSPAAEETPAEFPEASEMGRGEHPAPIHYHSTHGCVTAIGTGPGQQNPSEMGREICTACAVTHAEGRLPREGRLRAATSPWEPRPQHRPQHRPTRPQSLRASSRGARSKGSQQRPRGQKAEQQHREPRRGGKGCVCLLETASRKHCSSLMLIQSGCCVPPPGNLASSPTACCWVSV